MLDKVIISKAYFAICTIFNISISTVEKLVLFIIKEIIIAIEMSLIIAFKEWPKIINMIVSHVMQRKISKINFLAKDRLYFDKD